MMLLFNFIFSGAWFAAVLICSLLEFESFREYVNKLINAVGDNKYPYSYIIHIVVWLSVFSWIGFVIEVALVIDYLKWLKSNKE